MVQPSAVLFRPNMILGVGTDLVDIRRIEASIERLGQRFLDRVFTHQEQFSCFKRSVPAQSFAKIFAAKEAVLKALGNVEGIHWKHIEISHFPSGKPYVILTERALENCKALLLPGQTEQIDLSITDEPPYASAFVVISTR